MGVFQERFAVQIKELSNTEKFVFYYIDNYISEVCNLNLTAFAEKTNTSNTTIIRMCKKLGFDGFSQFKYDLQKLCYETRTAQEKELLKQYQVFTQNILSDIQIKDLEYLAHKMYDVENVYIIAVGLSKPLGEYFAKRLIQFQKLALYFYDSHIIDLLPKMLGNNDCVIYVSLSGETSTIVKSAEKLAFRNVSVFSITNNPESPLSKIVKRNISTSVPPNVYAGYDVTSRSFLMLQIDVLLEIYLKYMLSKQ